VDPQTHLETQRVTSCAAVTRLLLRSNSSDCRCVTCGLASLVADTATTFPPFIRRGNVSSSHATRRFACHVAAAAEAVVALVSTTQKARPMDPSQARLRGFAMAAATPE
jgi:hypothetical protein